MFAIPQILGALGTLTFNRRPRLRNLLKLRHTDKYAVFAEVPHRVLLRFYPTQTTHISRISKFQAKSLCHVN